ncbi:MAG: hypothetical protein LUC99_04215 [Clostridiales bacterium]|nr:hypothetical protein [Clostridiales bacterium]
MIFGNSFFENGADGIFFAKRADTEGVQSKAARTASSSPSVPKSRRWRVFWQHGLTAIQEASEIPPM